MNALIKEIFESIQGEGLLVGRKQLFIRFCDCNLNCQYCDTDFSHENAIELSEEELFDKIKKYDAPSISFTGGEPLLQANFIRSFLKKYKKFLNKEIYLETNGVLYDELEKVIEFIDVVGMDIKISTATNQDGNFDLNDKFLEIAKGKVFIKTVFTPDIRNEEIEIVSLFAKKYDAPLVIQPKTPIEDAPYFEIFNKFYSIYDDVRLIPQTHTLLKLQ